MVFLIQSTQNRDAKAIHLKLDELIRSSQARNVFADLENATDEELDVFQREFEELRKRGLGASEAMIQAQQNAAQSDEQVDQATERVSAGLHCTGRDAGATGGFPCASRADPTYPS